MTQTQLYQLLTSKYSDTKDETNEKLSILRKDTDSLRNQRYGLIRRMATSKHTSLIESRVQEIDAKIKEQCQKRDLLYGNMGQHNGLAFQHADAKKEFDKRTAAMQNSVQQILKNNEKAEQNAQEITNATLTMEADTEAVRAKRKKLA